MEGGPAQAISGLVRLLAGILRWVRVPKAWIVDDKSTNQVINERSTTEHKTEHMKLFSYQQHVKFTLVNIFEVKTRTTKTQL